MQAGIVQKEQVSHKPLFMRDLQKRVNGIEPSTFSLGTTDQQALKTYDVSSLAAKTVISSKVVKHRFRVDLRGIEIRCGREVVKNHPFSPLAGSLLMLAENFGIKPQLYLQCLGNHRL